MAETSLNAGHRHRYTRGSQYPAAVLVIGLTYLLLATMALVLGPTVCQTFGG